jgi:hypothetical protein
MNIIEKIIADGIAKNVFQATHIANGLKLVEMKTDDERLARCRLYRDWRNAGEKSATAYAKAIAGEAVPAPMFAEMLHSEES